MSLIKERKVQVPLYELSSVTIFPKTLNFNGMSSQGLLDCDVV